MAAREQRRAPRPRRPSGAGGRRSGSRARARRAGRRSSRRRGQSRRGRTCRAAAATRRRSGRRRGARPSRRGTSRRRRSGRAPRGPRARAAPRPRPGPPPRSRDFAAVLRERVRDALPRELQLRRRVERDDREPGRHRAGGPARRAPRRRRGVGGACAWSPMVTSRLSRFKWYVAPVTQVVRVQFTVEANYDGWRLDRYLQEKIRRLSRERVQHLIEHRLECEGGAPAEAVHPRRRRGSRSRCSGTRSPSRTRRSSSAIVHDDGELLVVDKPAGLPVHPTARYSANTFTSAARLRFPDRKVDPAHRLDRETSGLLACGVGAGVDEAAQARVRRGRDREDLPRARARGRPPRTASPWTRRSRSPAPRAVRVRMHVSPGGQPSVTEFEVLERRAAARRRAGRAPRLPAAHRPPAPDPRPPPPRRAAPRRRQDLRARRADLRPLHPARADRRRPRRSCGSPRQALHAWRLELPHPRTGERVRLETPLPPDLAGFWERCARA